MHVEYGSATVSSGVFNKGSLAQRSNPLRYRASAHSAVYSWKTRIPPPYSAYSDCKRHFDLAGRVLNKRDRTVEAHVAFVDDRSAIASRAVLNERQRIPIPPWRAAGAPIAYGYGPTCGLDIPVNGAVIDTQLSRLHFDRAAVPPEPSNSTLLFLKGVLPMCTYFTRRAPDA